MSAKQERLKYTPFSPLTLKMMGQGWRLEPVENAEIKSNRLIPPEGSVLEEVNNTPFEIKNWQVIFLNDEIILPIDAHNFENFSLSVYQSQKDFSNTALGITSEAFNQVNSQIEFPLARNQICFSREMKKIFILPTLKKENV